MKVWETKKDLEKLREENRVYKQVCTMKLVDEFRQSYEKYEFLRRIIKFLSRGRLCKLDQYSWTYEILEEVHASFWYREIVKFHAFHEAEIDALDYHLSSLDQTNDSPQSVMNMIRIIRDVVTE